MTNEERIERLRKCASYEICNPEMCDLWSKDDCRSILLKDAADALEAAERLLDQNTKRCEALRKQLRESHESYEKRIAELEAQAEALKEESEAY
jgi:aminoglycoside phosphotransferase